MALKLYIKDELEKIVEKTSDSREAPELFEVATITFATANKKLIKLLAQRGSVITSGKLKKL